MPKSPGVEIFHMDVATNTVRCKRPPASCKSLPRAKRESSETGLGASVGSLYSCSLLDIPYLSRTQNSTYSLAENSNAISLQFSMKQIYFILLRFPPFFFLSLLLCPCSRGLRRVDHHQHPLRCLPIVAVLIWSSYYWIRARI